MSLLMIIFQVFTGEDESVEAGQIVKHWGGCREVFGGANDFSLHCELFQILEFL